MILELLLLLELVLQLLLLLELVLDLLLLVLDLLLLVLEQKDQSQRCAGCRAGQGAGRACGPPSGTAQHLSQPSSEQERSARSSGGKARPVTHF